MKFLAQALRKLGYNVEIIPTNAAPGSSMKAGVDPNLTQVIFDGVALDPGHNPGQPSQWDVTTASGSA